MLKSEITPSSARGTLWDTREQTQVGCMLQGKCPIGWTMAQTLTQDTMALDRTGGPWFAQSLGPFLGTCWPQFWGFSLEDPREQPKVGSRERDRHSLCLLKHKHVRDPQGAWFSGLPFQSSSLLQSKGEALGPLGPHTGQRRGFQLRFFTLQWQQVVLSPWPLYG